MSLKFKYTDNKDIVKEINSEVDINDYNSYRSSLKVLRTRVNEFLSELVNKEAGKNRSNCDDFKFNVNLILAPEEIHKEEKFSDSDSDDNIEQRNIKRNLSNDRDMQKRKSKKQ